jgi:hypothetical protein
MDATLIEVWASDLLTAAFRTLDEAIQYASEWGYPKARFHAIHEDGVVAYRAAGFRYLYFKKV